MKAFEKALSVVQNNVTNASTPGYVRQQADLIALAFQPDLELTGGVRTGSLLSSRSIFSERAVWQQAEHHGRQSQVADGLVRIEPVFDISDGSGIASSIDKLYASFSQLSVTPNSTPARQNVIDRAKAVAETFNGAARSLSEAADHTRREARSVVEQINRIASDIRELNVEFRRDYRQQEDAGLKARLYTALEKLSALVDFNALPQEDGSMTILLGGQTPLVIGDKTFAVEVDLSGSRVEILDFNGKTITGQVRQGRLEGLIELSNDLLPSYSAKLNRLAAAFADGVNAELAQGVDQNGLPPTEDLFTYAAPDNAALTLSVTGITPDQIAAADPTEPGGNGNALKLASLATARKIDDFTYTEFYGQISAQAGRDLAAAREGEHTRALLLSQAQNLRDEKSAVNLDEEAALLMQYQQAYRASAQLVSVLNEMTDVVLGLLR